MGCVLSTGSLTQLLASRLIMGFGGGAFLVRVIILTGLLFPGKARAAAATKLYLVLAAFEVPYPTVMGWITDTFHWNYAFLVDFPFLAIGAFLIWKLVPPGFLYERRKDGQVDVWGRASADCLAGLPGNCHQSRRARSVVPVELDYPGSGAAAMIFFIAFLWWDYRPQNLSPILHLRMIVRHASLRTYFLVILIVERFSAPGFMSCRNTSASSRITAPCKRAVLFRCTRSAWGWGSSTLCIC
jgi:MFS transporter, DHA2 family, multidrug resistance protein